jgi:hypothetical protein
VTLTCELHDVARHQLSSRHLLQVTIPQHSGSSSLQQQQQQQHIQTAQKKT